MKITTIYMIYKPVEQTHYCVESFTAYHVKRAYSLCVIKKKKKKKKKKIYIKV